MSRPMLFSDLDHTLIYSHRALNEYGDDTTQTVPVEEYKDRTLSYMSSEVWKRLGEDTHIRYDLIPTTTRTLRQYSRVVFPHEPRIAIIENGARILIEGEEDKEWSRKTREQVNSLRTHPMHVRSILFEAFPKYTYEEESISKIELVNNAFIYVASTVTQNWRLDGFMHELSQLAGYTYSKQGRKSYLIPKCVSKHEAVKEIISRYNPEISFATGDSNLDISMSEVVDHFILPAHGKASGNHEAIRTTSSSGIQASTEILDTVRGLL